MIDTIPLQNLIDNPQQFIRLVENKTVFFYPTDTIYGLGAKVSKETIETLYKLKNRPRDKALSLIAPSFEWVDTHITGKFSIQKEWERYKNQFPKRGLTVLCTLKHNSDLPLELLTPNNKIGIRFINHPMQKLITQLDQPFISTSANLSGKEPINKPSEVATKLPGFSGVILTGFSPMSTKPSVIIDIETKKILRK